MCSMDASKHSSGSNASASIPPDAAVMVLAGANTVGAADTTAAGGDSNKDVAAASTAATSTTIRRWWPPDTQRLLLRRFPGVKIPEAALCIAVGMLMFFAVPRPPQLSAQAWGLFSIFVATILALVLEPLPSGAVAFTSITVCLWTGVLSYPEAFAATGNDTIWLILGAFFFAKGVELTGLGQRLADVLILALGRTSLGLAYALALAELVLCLCMPSTTARAAGVFVPIITSLSRSYDSYPPNEAAAQLITAAGPADPAAGTNDAAGNDSRPARWRWRRLRMRRHASSTRGTQPCSSKWASARRLGEFLFLSQVQVSNATSAVFLIGAAQTPAALQLAAGAGVVVPNAFVTYLKGSVVPALLLVGLVPLAVHVLHTPSVRRTPGAPAAARTRLKQRGRMTWREWVMAATLLGAIVCWCTSSYWPFKLSNASVALLGVVVLLASGAITWDDLLSHKPAWDLFIWLVVLFSVCGAMSKNGTIAWLSDSITGPLQRAPISQLGKFWLLQITYFALHYVIGGQAAHVAALFLPFLQALVAVGTNPQLAALSLAYNTNLFGSITQFASAQAASYYGAGYFVLWKLWATGGLLGFSSLALFLAVGMGWWRAVGLW